VIKKRHRITGAATFDRSKSLRTQKGGKKRKERSKFGSGQRSLSEPPDSGGLTEANLIVEGGFF
jgi:hypothetical protein